MTDRSPGLARVVSLEVWDDHAGARVDRGAPGARMLWRVDVAEALASDASDAPDVDDMETLFVRLHEHGDVDEDELARSRLLLVAVREQDAERRARQAARAPDAPRALLSESSGAVIARPLLPFAIAVANGPDEDTGPGSSATIARAEAGNVADFHAKRKSRWTPPERPLSVKWKRAYAPEFILSPVPALRRRHVVDSRSGPPTGGPAG
jgi:hypothetical protein